MLNREKPERRVHVGAWLLIVLGAVWVIANAGATATRLRSPLGSWAMQVNYDGVVSPVPAGRSNHLDLAQTDRRSLIRLVTTATKPHETAAPWFAGAPAADTVTASTEELSRARRVTLALRSLGAIAMIVLASVLLLRIPTVPIFGFYLFALGFSPMSETALNAYLPATFAVVQNLLNDVTEGLGLWGITLFFAEFGAGRPVMRTVVAAFAALGTLCGVVADVRLELAHQPSAWFFNTSQVLIGIGALVTFVLLHAKYSTVTKRARTRIRWIYITYGVGFALYLLAYMADNNGPFISEHLSAEALDLFYLAIVLIPAAVVYAVLRHHVMDFGLFVSKGTVYGLLATAIVLGLQGLVAWTEPAMQDVPYLAVVAIFLAVAFHPLKQVGHDLIARYFARRRTASLRTLRRSVRLFSRITSFEQLEKIMVHRTAKSLHLAGAALLSTDRVLAATSAYVGRDAELLRLASDSEFREEVETSRGAVRLHRGRYPALSAFHDDIQPLAAIVLQNPGLQFHVFVVGPHQDGSDLDIEELQAIEEFVREGLIAHLVIAVRSLEAQCGTTASPLAT